MLSARVHDTHFFASPQSITNFVLNNFLQSKGPLYHKSIKDCNNDNVQSFQKYKVTTNHFYNMPHVLLFYKLYSKAISRAQLLITTKNTKSNEKNYKLIIKKVMWVYLLV